MSRSLRFIGLDVHKDLIVIAVAESGREPAYVQPPGLPGTRIKKFARKTSFCRFGMQREQEEVRMGCRTAHCSW